MKSAPKLHTLLASTQGIRRRGNRENLAPTSPYHHVFPSSRRCLGLTATGYQWFLVSLLTLLMGCNSSPTSSTSETPTSSSSSAASQSTTASPLPSLSPSNPATFKPTKASPTAISPIAAKPSETSPALSSTASKPLSPPTSDFMISANGIGAARVGMKLGQLKQLLAGKAEFKVKSPFMVDFDAIAVSQAGKVQYYILYPAGTPLANSDIIEALVTDNPNYRTAQGVGPGTPIKQVEAVYGDATLFYNTALESREYVKFAKQPSNAIAFHIKPSQAQPLAGIYSSSNTELKQTKEFKKTASIGFVEVYCRQNCPLPSP